MNVYIIVNEFATVIYYCDLLRMLNLKSNVYHQGELNGWIIKSTSLARKIIYAYNTPT